MITDDDGVGGVHRFIDARAEPALEVFLAGLGIERHEALSHKAESHAFAVDGGEDGRGVAGHFFLTAPNHPRFAGPTDFGCAIPSLLAGAGPDGFAGLGIKGYHAAVGLAAHHGEQ